MHGRQLDEATLRFLSGEGSSVSSEVLAQTLRGLQTAVWLLGAQALEHSVNERFKPGQELRQHYELVCRAPETGSYAMPIELWDIRQQPDLASPSDLLGRAFEVARAVSEGDREALRERMPDSFLRNRMLRELARFLPRPGDTWKLDVERSGASVTLDASSGRTAESWLRVPEETATMTVTGDLVRVDFEENKVVIRHPVTNRLIDCYARPDVIDDLVENHYEPVQVTGVFTLDENDHPIKLTDVSVVETVDLSPLTIDAVVLEGQPLVPSPPLVLTPTLDPETKQVLLASDEGLGLSAVAPTRDQLYEELVDEIAFVWEAYALEDDEILSPAAAELKKRLLERFQVSRDGV